MLAFASLMLVTLDTYSNILIIKTDLNIKDILNNILNKCLRELKDLQQHFCRCT